MDKGILTGEERIRLVLSASAEQLAEIDAVLTGSRRKACASENLRLYTIKEACQMTGFSYDRMRFAIADGLVDVVSSTGRRLITSESLGAFVRGERKPSQEVLERRAARNAERRARYRDRSNWIA